MFTDLTEWNLNQLTLISSMLCSRSSMPTWLPEVLRFVAWGSQTGWLGLVCPAHCSASLPLLAAVFVAGLSSGALLVVVFLWISPTITFPCPSFASSPTSRPQREPSRLLAYTCMSAGALLAESVRTAISGLRALASALEEALHRFDNSRHGISGDVENQADSQPYLGLPGDSVTTAWDFVSTASVAQSAPVPAVLPLAGHRPPSVPASSTVGSDFSTESYHRVAASLDPLPGYCIDLCVRLGGTKEEVEFRARRAWEAGLWAKATLEGVVPKPRPTPKFHLRPTIYIIIRAPSVVRPVRVDSAAEYFKLIPSFSGSSSISHGFASVAEARVYCAGVGIALPDTQ